MTGGVRAARAIALAVESARDGRTIDAPASVPPWALATIAEETVEGVGATVYRGSLLVRGETRLWAVRVRT